LRESELDLGIYRSAGEDRKLGWLSMRFGMDSANGCQGLLEGLSWIMTTGGNPLLLELCSAFQFTEVQLAALCPMCFLLVTRFAQAGKVAALNPHPSQVFFRGRNR